MHIRMHFLNLALMSRNSHGLVEELGLSVVPGLPDGLSLN
jgi:hypothetical protein